MNPLPVHELALVELHVSVEDWPLVIEAGLALSETVGAAAFVAPEALVVTVAPAVPGAMKVAITDVMPSFVEPLALAVWMPVAESHLSSAKPESPGLFSERPSVQPLPAVQFCEVLLTAKYANAYSLVAEVAPAVETLALDTLDW